MSMGPVGTWDSAIVPVMYCFIPVGLIQFSVAHNVTCKAVSKALLLVNQPRPGPGCILQFQFGFRSVIRRTETFFFFFFLYRPFTNL